MPARPLIAVPEYYVEEEGGKWLPWDQGELPWSFLDGSYTRHVYDMHKKCVHFRNKSFHALKFADGVEWDCINGWRKR